MEEIKKRLKRWLSSLKGARRQSSYLSAGIALLVGGVLCLEGRSLLRSREPAVEDPRYLVAKRELSAGHPISFLDFTIEHREALGEVPEGAYTDQDWTLLQGQHLRLALSRGDVLQQTSLAAPLAKRLAGQIPRGYRAYSLEVANPMALAPGDYVDILFSPQDRRELPITLVEGALVLQAEREKGSEGITVAVAPSQLQLLEKARQSGKLTLALRNPSEVVPPTKRVRQSRRSVRKKSRIEVWSEGE